jgi:hypothetical protein
MFARPPPAVVCTIALAAWMEAAQYIARPPEMRNSASLVSGSIALPPTIGINTFRAPNAGAGLSAWLERTGNLLNASENFSLGVS